jgi:Na+-transporting NADH:ubiquinone oxidoreductase subunit C
MASREGTLYTVSFAAVVCIVCAVLVSVPAVTLRPRQELNRRLDEQKNVLRAAGLVDPGQALSRERVAQLFAENVQPVVIDLASGEPRPGIDAASFDQRTATADPQRSRAIPANPAKVLRTPYDALVYEVKKGDRVEMYVFPVTGKGLWSTLYGFLALDADLETIRGLTFYEHGETPGLGGEIENPAWQKLWQGRRAFGPDGKPRIEVIKGHAGPPAADPYHVDGLSGATMTSNGVTALVQFWLGDAGYGPFLEKLREEARQASAPSSAGDAGGGERVADGAGGSAATASG